MTCAPLSTHIAASRFLNSRRLKPFNDAEELTDGHRLTIPEFAPTEAIIVLLITPGQVPPHDS